MATPEAAMVPDNVEQIEQFCADFGERALVLRKSVEIVKIENVEQYNQVCTAGKDAAANIKAIQAYIKPIKDQRYAAWKRVTEIESSRIAPYEEIKTRSSKLAGSYQYEQQRQAELAAAAERERLQKEAEAQRAQEAEQLAKEGRIAEGIAHLESETIVTAPVMTAAAVPKITGVSAPVERCKAEVTDFRALLQAVLDGKVPELAIVANQKFLDQQARSLKKLLNYPGVKVVAEATSSFRG